jgi:hypothetical protein
LEESNRCSCQGPVVSGNMLYQGSRLLGVFLYCRTRAAPTGTPRGRRAWLDTRRWRAGLYLLLVLYSSSHRQSFGGCSDRWPSLGTLRRSRQGERGSTQRSVLAHASLEPARRSICRDAMWSPVRQSQGLFPSSHASARRWAGGLLATCKPAPA